MLRRILPLLSFALLSIASTQAQAQSSSIIGTVIDATSKQPIAGVNVSATSPDLPDPQNTATDAQGNYRLTQLPPGVYTLRYESNAYRPYARADVQLRLNRTIRVNVELLPASLLPPSGQP